MDEGTSKTIPLRRSRTRAVAIRSASWTDRLATGVRRTLEPPRQLWLATLGGPALILRGIRETWAELVTEGTAVEASIGRFLGRQPTPPPARESATH